MLSRREKLLVQPWQDRRYEEHRSKVLRARAAVDSSCPARRPHVRVKAARWRRERERLARVASDNRRLLRRLADVMRARTLDNRWEKPLPNFHQKVGRYFDSIPAPGRKTVLSRDCRCMSRDCRCVTNDSRVEKQPLKGVKCYACEVRKMKTQQTFQTTFEDQLVLPSLNMY